MYKGCFPFYCQYQFSKKGRREGARPSARWRVITCCGLLHLGLAADEFWRICWPPKRAKSAVWIMKSQLARRPIIRHLKHGAKPQVFVPPAGLILACGGSSKVYQLKTRPYLR